MCVCVLFIANSSYHYVGTVPCFSMGNGDSMIIIYSTINVYGLQISQVLSIVPGHGWARCRGCRDQQQFI
jgi:hypothetical protein